MSQLANNFAELSNSLRYDHWYFKTSNNSTIQNVNSFLDNGVFGHTFHVSRDLEQTKKFLCEVNVWSNKNPNHIPITLFLNAKEDNLGSEDLITLNKILLDTLGNKLFSCETFCGNWPLVNAMLNKIVVVLTGNSQVRSRYYWEKSIMNPCVAANIHGKILVVFNKMSDSQIPEVWYYTGEYLADGCIRWDCTGRVGTGSTPSVLLTNHGSGLLVYEIEQELFYSVIKIQDNNDVTWQPGTRYDKGITPSISIRDPNGNTFIEVHRSEKDNAKMWTHVGKIIDTNEGKVVMEQSKCISQQIIGYFPSIRYYPNRDIEVLYESENLDKLELHGSKITNTLIGWNTKGIKLTDKKSFNEDAVVKDGQFVRIKIVDGVLQYETDRKSGLVRLTQLCFVDYLPTIDLNFKQEVQKPGKLMFASLNAKCDPSEIGKLKARNMMVRFWSYNEIKPAKNYPNFAATDDPLSMEYQKHYETFWSDKQRNPEEELAKVKKECLQSLTNLKGEFAENLVKILSEYETAVKNETSRLIKECNLDPNLRSDMMQHEHQRLEKLKHDFMELNGMIECLDQPSISAEKFKKRWHLVQEILESEWNFSKKLETLLTEFYHPLKLYSTSTMATKEELNIMFDCVPELLKASNTTLAGLEEAVKDYSMHEMIADVFLQMLPYFKCFSLFVNNVPEALKTYNNCMNREAFSKFVNKKIDYTIPGLLDSPVRRMGLVRALLKNLLDELDPNHKDYTKLSQAHQKFTQLNEETNKLKEVSENRQKVLAISEKVEKELVQPDRLFVREGHLMTKNGNGVIDISTYVFLFTDALVITHQKRLNSFTFRELLLFSECEFRKLNTSEYCGFCLTKGEKSIEFYAHTEGDCKGWNEDLSKLFHQNKTNRISRAPSVVWRQ